MTGSTRPDGRKPATQCRSRRCAGAGDDGAPAAAAPQPPVHRGAGPTRGQREADTATAAATRPRPRRNRAADAEPTPHRSRTATAPRPHRDRNRTATAPPRGSGRACEGERENIWDAKRERTTTVGRVEQYEAQTGDL